MVQNCQIALPNARPKAYWKSNPGVSPGKEIGYFLLAKLKELAFQLLKTSLIAERHIKKWLMKVAAVNA